MRVPLLTLCVATLFSPGLLHAAAPHVDLHPVAGDFVIHKFEFRSGERLDALRLHYMTLGHPSRDRQGRVANAVLILHGTTGSGDQFLRPQFADELFRAGGLLDPARYYIVLADDIGHGKSSKPSDGLHAHFPSYGYTDMVTAEHTLLTEGLGVDHLRLVLGTSMGCMHTFMWGETYPKAMDALMALACLPVPIAGRNRMWRKMVIDAIRNDPDWAGGEYKDEPRQAMRAVADLIVITGAAAVPAQRLAPTGDAADRYVEERIADFYKTTDANDLLYAVEASRDYDPESGLERIVAPITWINSADDFINPPELGIAEREAARLKNGRFRLIPATEHTHGHSTHTWAENWEADLAELLDRSAPR